MLISASDHSGSELSLCYSTSDQVLPEPFMEIDNSAVRDYV